MRRKTEFFTISLLFWALLSQAVASDLIKWQRAIDRDDVEVIRQLLPDVDVSRVNEKGKSALMSVARLGEINMLESLRQRGLKLSDRSNTGGTSLMYAALGNQLPMIRHIMSEVDSPGFIDAQSANGWTALMIAAAKGFEETVRLLVELGADPSLADAYQWTPLMRAIDNRHHAVVKYLVGCDDVKIDSVNENGLTALHVAALINDEFSAAQLLARAPGLVFVRDKAGNSAQQIASLNGNRKLADFIAGFGG